MTAEELKREREEEEEEENVELMMEMEGVRDLNGVREGEEGRMKDNN